MNSACRYISHFVERAAALCPALAPRLETHISRPRYLRWKHLIRDWGSSACLVACAKQQKSFGRPLLGLNSWLLRLCRQISTLVDTRPSPGSRQHASRTTRGRFISPDGPSEPFGCLDCSGGRKGASALVLSRAVEGDRQGTLMASAGEIETRLCSDPWLMSSDEKTLSAIYVPFMPWEASTTSF